MATFPHDPSTIEVFHSKLAHDDPMWVAHAPLDEFLAFLENPTGWVTDLACAKGAEGRTFVLSPQFVIEIRGLEATEVAPGSQVPADAAAEVTMMGISGTGLVVVRASKDMAGKASNHFTSHFVASCIPDAVKAKHGLDKVAKTLPMPSSSAGGTAVAERKTYYELNDDQFIGVFSHLADYKANVTVYRTDKRVYSHLKISDGGTMNRAERLGAVATFLFGCSSVPERLHGILNSCHQHVLHYQRGSSEPIPGTQLPVKFAPSLPSSASSTPLAHAAVTPGAGAVTTPSFIYSSDQDDNDEACDAIVGCTDSTYTNGTTEVSYTKDYAPQT